jgi:phage-related protein
MIPNFEIEILGEAIEFLEKLDSKTRDKILYNFKKSQYKNDVELFKTLYNSLSYRFFAFWIRIDGKVTMVVATHGIVKSTQKTPNKEIKKAEEIRRLYINNINHQDEK